MFSNTLKKIAILVTLGVTLLSATAVVATPVSAKSLQDDLTGFVDSMFSDSSGSGIVSFTDFQGGLKPPTPDGYDASLTQVTSGREFVVKVVNYALGFLGLFAVLIVIYGGFLYVSSAGESEGPEKGKKAIMYAIIGIIIIFGSYAIVNTVLKAPGGNLAAQPNGAIQPQFAGGPQYGRNVQATRAYNLAIYTIHAYQNYAGASLALEGMSMNIDKLWNHNKFTSENDAASAINQIENAYNPVVDSLKGIVSQSADYSTVSDMVDYQRLAVKNWIQSRRTEISILQNAPVNAGTLTNLSADEEKVIGNIQNCSVDSPLTQPTDAQCIAGRFADYKNVFEKQYQSLVLMLQNGVYTTDSTDIGIGIVQIKSQLDKDFESAMEYANKEAASIQTSASAWPQSITDLFNQLYGVSLPGSAIPGGKNVFNALNAGKKDPVKSKENLRNVAVILGQLYEGLKDLQGIDAKLNVSVKEGNAPLIVTFSTVGSVDPSNKSIQDSQILWDLDGNGKFSDPGQNAIGCEEKQAATATCVYKKPGTYRVGVKIDPATGSNVVQGVQYIDIKVNPPRARFSIQLETTQNNTKQVIPITDYDKDGLLKIDRDRVQLAYSDTAKGLKFSAIGTVSGGIIDKSDKSIDLSKKTQETIQRMRWSFGDGTTVDDSPAENPSIMSVDHSYASRGTYQVALEVTGKDGVVDRKLFYVTIADISAIIYVNPGYTNKVSTPVSFSSAVTSDGSKVSEYEWTSTSDSSGIFSSKSSNFTATPSKPGTYTVMLKVKNENSNEASDKVDVIIESNPPVAKFSVKTPKASVPAERIFDGSESYDPDGTNTKITYLWTLDGQLGKDYTFTQGSESDRTVRIRFLTTGDRTVTLTAEDPAEKGKTTKASTTVKVPSILDGDWTTDTQSSGILDASGSATIPFGIISKNGASYSFDYGDGEVEDGLFSTNQTITTKHIYRKAGLFTAAVTIQDDQGASVKLNKKIAIGNGNSPVAASKILLNGDEIDTTQTVVASRKDVFTFDATDAKNIDGTLSNLQYAWDFGDGKKSTKAIVSYSYKDLSPKIPGFYTVTLVVSDKSDPTKKSQSSLQIQIVPQKPTLKTITVIPLGAEYKTPLKVQLKAVEAKAPEGQITTYRWWYYDVKDNTNELGSQITTVPETTIMLGTKGQEGDQVTYVFQVELRDSMNQTTTALDILGEDNLPTLTVTNGPNKTPLASFTVAKTSVGVGEAVTFTSSSTDSDGKIASYVWDLDGDGFQNDLGTTKSSVTRVYTTPAQEGIKVRLKVIDDSFAETISDPITIYVTSKYAAPKAAFYYQQKPGTMQIAFQNASSADTNLTLSSYIWDFDTVSNYPSADTNNNGSKTDDVDSTGKDVTAAYQNAGTYYVKLTVKDSAGVAMSIISPVVVKALSASQSGTPSFSIPEGVPAVSNTSLPLAAKLSTIPAADPMDGKIHLTGSAANVTIDFSSSQGAITKYAIDKNIYFDSNSDGKSDNDENYTSTKAGQWVTDFQKAWGKDTIKLTVYDASGKSSSVTRDIVFDAPLASGANNIFVVPGAYQLYASLAGMFGFGILSYRNRKRKNTKA